jgi:hypothetical protein
VKQSALERAVARATGEPVGLIRRLGFTLVIPSVAHPEDEAGPTAAPEKTALRPAPGHGAGTDRTT